MTEANFIERLAEAVAHHIRPAIPLSIELWDIATIAAYLKRDAAVVRERIVCVPEFPKAIRFPTKLGRSQPLYNAMEVIKWAQGHKERH